MHKQLQVLLVDVVEQSMIADDAVGADQLAAKYINGGAIDGTAIGANSASTGNFSQVSISGTDIFSNKFILLVLFM